MPKGIDYVLLKNIYIYTSNIGMPYVPYFTERPVIHDFVLYVP